MKKKLFGIVLSVMLVAAMLPTMVFAGSVDDCSNAACTHEAAIGTTHYDTLSEAIGAAGNGDTVKLLKNVSAGEKIEIDAAKKFILDLNGYVITANCKASRLFWITTSNVDMTINGTTSGSGMEIGDTNSTAPANKVWGFVDIRLGANNAKVTVNGGSYTGSVCANDNYNYGSFFMVRGNNDTLKLNNVNANTDVCVVNWDGGSGILDVNAGTYTITGIDAYLQAAFYTGYADASFDDMTLTSKYGGCVYTAKKAELTNCNINVTDDRSGAGTHQNCAVAVSHGGIVTINSGTYSAPYAVYAYNSGGNIVIKDGYFTGSKAAVKSDASTTSNKPSVTIEDGSFTGDINLTKTDAINNISGGTFDSTIDESYLAEDFVCNDNGDGTYGVKTIKAAQIDETIYASLQDAINAAGKNDVIVLVNNVTENITIINGKDITIDLNGKKLTGGIDLGENGDDNKSANLTIRDSAIGGKINYGSGYKSIQVYGSSELTILSGIIESEIDTNDNSKLNIKGGTFNEEIDTYDNSVTVIENGIFNEEVESRGNSTMTINGGTFADDLNSRGNSTLTVNNGQFDLQADSVDNSTMTINGGTFKQITECRDDSIMIIKSGTFSDDRDNKDVAFKAMDNGNVTIEGGVFLNSIVKDGNAVINITGGIFSENPDSLLGDEYSVSTNDEGKFVVSRHVHEYGETTYTWSDDYLTCTAKRVCSYKSSHVETETVRTESVVTQKKSYTQDELTKYTATFTNPAFEQQIKENIKTADKLTYEDAAKTGDNSNMEFWIAILCLAVVAGVGAVLYKRKTVVK